MQQHFDAHVFQMEQQEYAAERIDVAHVSYVNNQPCLDLIEGGRSSILAMSDEELRLPGGSDDNLLTRMHQAHGNNKFYGKPKTAVPLFIISHYAGPSVFFFFTIIAAHQRGGAPRFNGFPI